MVRDPSSRVSNLSSSTEIHPVSCWSYEEMRGSQLVLQIPVLLMFGREIHVVRGNLAAKKHVFGWRENDTMTFSASHLPSFESHHLVSICFSCKTPQPPRSCGEYTCSLATEGFTLGQHINNDPWLQGIRVNDIQPLGPQGNTITAPCYKHEHPSGKR
jgi:hypothetical protein